MFSLRINIKIKNYLFFMKIIFTQHALDRLEKRKVIKYEAEDAIKFPDKIIKKHGEYFFRKRLDRGIIEICCEKTENNIKIITLYWL